MAASENNDIEPVESELCEDFNISGKTYSVQLCRQSLRYRLTGKQNAAKSVPINNIVGCPQIDDGFTLHYFVKTAKSVWKLQLLKLVHKDNTVCSRWMKQIEQYLDETAERPRRLLVFINPIGGKKAGEQIYRKKAAPIFKTARIETDVIVTQHALHSSEILEKYNLQTVDGVLIVGGDGTFTHVVTALLYRHAQEHNIDLHPHCDITPMPLRVGIIPAGTGQAMCRIATGTYDVVTAVLHIVSGHSQAIDIFSLYNGNQLRSFGTMMGCAGFFGDSIRISESNRQLGRGRYIYAITKALASHRSVNATVSILPVDCETENPTDWKEIKGPFKAINIVLCDMSTMMSEWYQYCHALDATLIKNVGRMKHLQELWKLIAGNRGENEANEENIERAKGRAVRWQFESSQSETSNGATAAGFENEVINIDGEPFQLNHPVVELRLHTEKVSMFGGGAMSS